MKRIFFNPIIVNFIYADIKVISHTNNCFQHYLFTFTYYSLNQNQIKSIVL